MNIQDALNEILLYFKKSAGDAWDSLEPQALEYTEDAKKRLSLILTESASGELSSEFLVERVKDELTILESQAISLGIISASFTQEVVNTTILNLLLTLINTLNGTKQ